MTSAVFFSACSEQVYSSQVRIAPDLVISSVLVESNSTPSENFPYYAWNLKVRIKNLGGQTRSGELYFSAGFDQENKKLTNQKKYFELKQNEEFEFYYQIVNQNTKERTYELHIDSGKDSYAQKNGGHINESNEKNNFHTLKIK
jgi:hypothetical protein